MTKQTFAIVGASLAGAKAAEELRNQGFDGHVLLIGSETERPYERPPLTKDYLRGESERDGVYVHPERFYKDQEIELLTDTTVSAIDPASGELSLESGRTLRFDRLLLSTGAEPKQLPLPGAELAGIHYLRTLADSDVLKRRLEAGGHVAVVGAGWIGSEFAASARQRGLEVTLIDQVRVPFESLFGAEIGGVYRDAHAQHGVELLLGTGIEAFEGSGSISGVRLSGGRIVECDFAVVGTGVAPRTALAEAAGLKVENGVLVDQSLKSSAANVYAAGDVANALNPFYDQHIRLEHWANALNQGPAAARSMLGKQVSYDEIPYFYSDQYELGMEYSGLTPEWDRVVFRGDRASGEFIAFWLLDGRVLAGMNVNVWDVQDHIRALIRSRKQIDVGALTDSDTPLEELAAAVA